MVSVAAPPLTFGPPTPSHPRPHTAPFRVYADRFYSLSILWDLFAGKVGGLLPLSRRGSIYASPTHFFFIHHTRAVNTGTSTLSPFAAIGSAPDMPSCLRRTFGLRYIWVAVLLGRHPRPMSIRSSGTMGLSSVSIRPHGLYIIVMDFWPSPYLQFLGDRLRILSVSPLSCACIA